MNISTPINSLGYGTCGLNAVLALEELGKEPALWVLGLEECPQEHKEVIKRAKQRTQTYDTKAPSVRIQQQFDLAQHVGKGCHASLTYFERDRLYANELVHLNNQDVVIASCEWMREVLTANGVAPHKIRIARPGVDRRIFKPCLTPPGPGPTTFLAVGKWEVRKGHDVLVDVFNRAFTPKDEVCLVLLTHNPFYTAEENKAWADQYLNTPLGGKVRIINGRLPSQRDVAHVMAQADVGVFLSRGEGWNLDLSEMLSMGKHCIATDFSSHTEYATKDNCSLIEIDLLEDAFDNRWFYGYGQWACLGERQLEQAVEHMRSMHRSKQEGSLGINQAALDSMKRFTWEGFAREIVEAVT